MLPGLLFPDHDLQQAPRRRILDAVAQDVDEHLLQAGGVPDDGGMLRLRGIDPQLVALFLDGGAEDDRQLADHIRNEEGLLRQVHLARFDLAHVQHLVDQVEEMPAGYGDLLKAVQHPGPVVDVADGDAGHAHDAVHGGADIVAHVGQKLAFCLVRMNCILSCPVQLLHLLVDYPEINRKNDKYNEYYCSAGT